MPVRPVALNKKTQKQARWHRLLCLLRSPKVSDYLRLIEILRTGYWLECLFERTDTTTPYALGKLLVPEHFGKNEDGAAWNDCSWSKYLSGTLVPSGRLDAVEDRMPGSMASFLHGFFDAIDLSKPIGNRGSESIRALHPAVQRAMFVNKPLAMGVYQRRVVSRQLLRWLERVGDLDALAGAIILLREAAERCNHALAFEIGMSVHRLLLAATITGPARQLRSEIAVVVLFRILRIAKSNGREFVPDLEQFWAAGNNLRLAICAADDWSNEPVSGKRAYDFLAGRPGSDLYFKFRATTALDSTQAEWPVESQVDVYTERKYSEWAWSISIFERERKPIPAQVTDEIARGIKAIRARNDPRLFPPELADADKRTFEQWLHIPRLTERPAIHGSGMERHPLLNSVDDTARSPRLPQLACAL